jgi:Leucine-rich repeat (LRR) protein
MENLSHLTALERLELYDNQILTLAELAPLSKLRILDMSYNLINNMSAVAACPLLEEVYIAQNRLRTIQGLEGLTRLRKVSDFLSNDVEAAFISALQTHNSIAHMLAI